MGAIELLGAGGAVASGWIAAFVVSVLLYRQRGALADLRVEAARLEHDLDDARTRLETERTQHEHWRSEAARLSGELADMEARTIELVDADELARLSSRGDAGAGDVRVPPRHPAVDEAGRPRGPVPAWVDADPGDPDVPGGRTP